MTSTSGKCYSLHVWFCALTPCLAVSEVSFLYPNSLCLGSYHLWFWCSQENMLFQPTNANFYQDVKWRVGNLCSYFRHQLRKAKVSNAELQRDKSKAVREDDSLDMALSEISYTTPEFRLAWNILFHLTYLNENPNTGLFCSCKVLWFERSMHFQVRSLQQPHICTSSYGQCLSCPSQVPLPILSSQRYHARVSGKCGHDSAPTATSGEKTKPFLKHICPWIRTLPQIINSRNVNWFCTELK